MEALAGFKSGKYEVMVATDIAARGIDVAGVSHVINYDVPEKPEDYVHRIGRTGRAQAVGDAFTLVTPENAGDIRDIQRFIGSKIPELKLEGFPYGPFTPRPDQPPQARESRQGAAQHPATVTVAAAGRFGGGRGRRQCVVPAFRRHWIAGMIWRSSKRGLSAALRARSGVHASRHCTI
jgi:ATP-dependent RNA helicase RhlE